MLSVTEAMFGFIHDPKRCNLTKSMDHFSRSLVICQNLLKRAKPGKDSIVFAIMREPINRLLSGWLDKCIIRLNGSRKIRSKLPGFQPLCYGCAYDLGCWVERNYKNMRYKINRTSTDLKDIIRAFPVQDHFMPTTWHCHSSTSGIKIRYLKYDRSPRFFHDLSDILRNAHVEPDKIVHIMNAISGKRTSHSTFDSHEYRSALNLLERRDDIYKLLLKTLYYDYVETTHWPIYPSPRCWLKYNPEVQASKYKIKQD